MFQTIHTSLPVLLVFHWSTNTCWIQLKLNRWSETFMIVRYGETAFIVPCVMWEKPWKSETRDTSPGTSPHLKPSFSGGQARSSTGRSTISRTVWVSTVRCLCVLVQLMTGIISATVSSMTQNGTIPGNWRVKLQPI